MIEQGQGEADDAKIEGETPFSVFRLFDHVVMCRNNASRGQDSQDEATQDKEHVLRDASPRRMTGSQEGRLQNLSGQLSVGSTVTYLRVRHFSRGLESRLD